MIVTIIVLIYLLIAFGAYKMYIVKFDNNTFEKVAFSLIWPLTLALYGVRKLHELTWK